MIRLQPIFSWLRDPHNRGALAVLGTGFAAIVGGAWALFLFFYPPSDLPTTIPQPTLVPISSFRILVTNKSPNPLTINKDGTEYYIHTALSPGQRKDLASGAVQFNNIQYPGIDIAPSTSFAIDASLMKETAARTHIDSKSNYIEIYLNTEPETIKRDFLFSRARLQLGLDLSYNATPPEESSLQSSALTEPRAPGYYGFNEESAATSIRDEGLPQLNERVGLSPPLGTTPFVSLCGSLGLACVEVIDWEGRKFDCADSRVADGSRAALCQ